MRRIVKADGNLEYLIDPIRRELEGRFGIYPDLETKVLIIDFEDGNMEFSGTQKIDRFDMFHSKLTKANTAWPYPSDSFDCVVSNLQGSWFDFKTNFSEVKRILKSHGAYYFSVFGPDTLFEINRAWSQVDSYPHVHEFVDMHHLGDALLRAGFEKPIVDADWMQVEYTDCWGVLADLRGQGFVNIDSDRRKSLTGKNRFQQFTSYLEKEKNAEGNLAITFEITYGYAKKPLHSDGTVLVTPPTI